MGSVQVHVVAVPVVIVIDRDVIASKESVRKAVDVARQVCESEMDNIELPGALGFLPGILQKIADALN